MKTETTKVNESAAERWVSYRPEIKILDCTIRDGGLMNDHHFDDETVKAVYPACVEAANKIKKGALTFGDLDAPDSEVRELLHEHYTIIRKPELGTGPNIYYIV